MERIKQAIEKVRTETPARVGDMAAAATPPPRPSIDLSDIQAITYSKTRVVPLDDDLLEQNRIVAHTKINPYGVAFDILRTRILHEMQEHGYRTLAITSPTTSCGKTVVAINLAFSLAHKPEQTVLLADFDLRKPAIADYLGLPAGSGLLDYIQGKVELSETLINPAQPRLVLLPNTKGVSNASEILTLPRTMSLVSDLRERYESRIILFDLPPLLATDDALAFLPQVDCVLLVVASGLTTTEEIEESRRLLSKANLLGVVLNKSDSRGQRYY